MLPTDIASAAGDALAAWSRDGAFGVDRRGLARDAEIDRLALRDETWEPVFRDVAVMAAVILNEAQAAVTVVDRATTSSVAVVGAEAFSASNDRTLCTLVVESGLCLAFPDVRRDPRLAERLSCLPPNVGRYAGAPVVGPDGTALGAVCGWGEVPGEFGPDELAALAALGRQAGALLTRHVDELEIATHHARDALRSQILSDIVAGRSLEVVLDGLARAVEQQAPDLLCSIMLVDDGHLRFGAAPSLPDEVTEAFEGVAIGENVGSCGSAAATGRPAVSADVATDPRWLPFREMMDRHGLRACWSLPVLDHRHVVVATFGIYYRTARRPDAPHWRLMHGWASLAGLAIVRSTEQEELRRSACTDGLTGLANRPALLTAIAHAIRTEKSRAPTTVVLCDLDGFKVLNDSLGHAFGDEYLVQLAARLSAADLGRVTIGRLGGDEFVVVGSGLRDVSSAQTLARRVLDVVRAPAIVAGRSVVLSGSAGIARRRSGDTPEDLIRHADAAMYVAKKRGRDTAMVADDALRGRITDRMALELDLRSAVERHEISLVYQPKVALRTGRLVGVEALARWEHPTRGAVPPAVFVPVAEESGTIVQLGALVLHDACQGFAHRWRDDAEACDVRVWVNVSVKQLEPKLLDTVRHALEDAKLPASRLGIEITESAFIGDADAVAAASDVLERLRALGVEVAVDDFGTGYSSLAQLWHLPVDVLKIDRAFVERIGADLADERVVAAIVGLGDALGLRVVAEGIETASQRDRLIALGCEIGQGYWIARPGGLETTKLTYPFVSEGASATAT